MQMSAGKKTVDESAGVSISNSHRIEGQIRGEKLSVLVFRAESCRLRHELSRFVRQVLIKDTKLRFAEPGNRFVACGSPGGRSFLLLVLGFLRFFVSEKRRLALPFGG